MAKITLWRGEDGKIDGYSERDKKAFKKLRKIMEQLELGQMFEIEFWFPRNGKFHRLHMKMESVLFDNQDQFTDFEWFRCWLKVGAGYCDLVPGPKGKPVAIAKSISYRDMDDVEMDKFHNDVKAFMRSRHARFFLWPHLPDAQSEEMVEGLLSTF